MAIDPKGGGAEIIFPIIIAAIVFVGFIIGLVVYTLKRMDR